MLVMILLGGGQNNYITSRMHKENLLVNLRMSVPFPFFFKKKKSAAYLGYHLERKQR